ncbi:MAG: hypothetical protein ILO68_06280, partial [Clostridia bacterium]|nr:hypothetical protein [Clostridia bacterium]
MYRALHWRDSAIVATDTSGHQSAKRTLTDGQTIQITLGEISGNLSFRAACGSCPGTLSVRVFSGNTDITENGGAIVSDGVLFGSVDPAVLSGYDQVTVVLTYTAGSGEECTAVCDILPQNVIPDAETELRYDDRIDVTGKNVVLIDPGTPTSNKVGQTESDDAVVSLIDGQLVATGIGEALVEIDGAVTKVTVSPAKISLFMIAGHSIGAGAKGDAGLSAVCPAGQVYSSFGRSNINSSVNGTGIGLASSKRIPNIDAFAPGGGGTVGEGSALGLQWNRMTGEKVLVMNTAVGGSCISNWLPGEAYYNSLVAQYTRAASVLSEEIRAGHFTLGTCGIFYHNAANTISHNPDFSIDDLKDWYPAFEAGLMTDLSTDIDGDGNPDAPDFIGFVPIWTLKSGVNFAQDMPASFYMSASADHPECFTASLCSKDWRTDEGVVSCFPVFEYTMQNGDTPVVPQSASEVFDGDRVHFRQIGYNAQGFDLANNLFAWLNRGNETPEVRLLDLDGVTEIGDVTSVGYGEKLTVVPVTDPMTASDLRFTCEGAFEMTFPLTVAPLCRGTGVLKVLHGDTVIKTLTFVCSDGPDPQVLEMRYDDRMDLSGKEYTVIDAGTPTSYKVGYGVPEHTPDDAVVRIEGETLIACGIGTAYVKIDGVITKIDVTAAPISLLLLIGQSNRRGREGNAAQSIVCPDGMVYSTYGDDRGATAPEGLSVSNAAEFAPSALAGEYSLVSAAGDDRLLQYYPIYGLTEQGDGRMGPDSGIAYEWVRATGEKVWLVNAAHGGTSVSAWQPNGTEYLQCLALFSACRDTLQKEIAAGHFTLSHMGYFWCQGCQDASQSADWYRTRFLSMHEAMKADHAFDHDSDPSTPDVTYEFADILLVMAGPDGTGYRTGIYESRPNTYYSTYLEMQMKGPRVAQIRLCADPAYPDINLVCTLCDRWLTMPDGTDGVRAYFESMYPDGRVDYTTQVKQKESWYTPAKATDVKDSIHYNQIGYNEVGRECARNAAILLGYLPDTETETTVRFVNWTGYEEVGEITARDSAGSDTLVVPLVEPCYRSKTVTYAVSEGLSYDGYDLTADASDASGVLTAIGAVGSVSVVPREYAEFRWETEKGALNSVGETENGTALLSGTLGATFENARVQLSEPVMLDHDQSWIVEIKMTGLWYSEEMPKLRKLLSADGADATVGAYALMAGTTAGRLWLGTYDGTTHVGCGVTLADYGVDMSEPHIYRLLNHVSEDGTNEIRLYVDGVFVAPMIRYYTGKDGDTGTESQMLSGVDFRFGFLGTPGYPLDGG